MNKPLIHHYGLHQEAGLVYIHQDSNGSGECWEYDSESPFQAKVGVRSPHWFLKKPTHDWNEMKHKRLLTSNPLLSALVPQIIEGRARLLLVPSGDSFTDTITMLGMLDFCCATNGGGFRVYNGNSGEVASVAKQLTITNLIPIIVSNLKLKDYRFVEELLPHMFQSTRNVVLLVPNNFTAMPGAEWIPPEVVEEARRFVEDNKAILFPQYGSSYLIEKVMTPLQAQHEEEDEPTESDEDAS